jgi:hypothetical protein
MPSAGCHRPVARCEFPQPVGADVAVVAPPLMPLGWPRHEYETWEESVPALVCGPARFFLSFCFYVLVDVVAGERSGREIALRVP